MTAFATPQWNFTIPQEHDTEDLALVKVDLGDETKVLKAPTELFKFALEVLGVKDTSSLLFYIERDDKRWYFGVEYEVDPERYDHMDLWYYTRSNLPVWARSRK